MSNSINEWITKLIVSFVEESPENNLGGHFHERAWDLPIVGFSRGDDDLYLFMKEDIGDFYWTPYEIFNMTFPEVDATSQQLSIISWILPQTQMTKDEQRSEKACPTERAVQARVNGDNFNRKVAEFVIDALEGKGYRSMSPMLSPLWETKESEKYSYASTWSERHTAYICGLGTFGLSDGLITTVGKAMRCGSVISKVDLLPSIRKYAIHNEYCLYYKNGSCMKCAERCPAGAITEKGHDKNKCREYQKNVTGNYLTEKYGINLLYCGICQFGVPCESGIPERCLRD